MWLLSSVFSFSSQYPVSLMNGWSEMYFSWLNCECIYLLYIFRVRDRFVKLKMVRSSSEIRTYHKTNQFWALKVRLQVTLSTTYMWEFRITRTGRGIMVAGWPLVVICYHMLQVSGPQPHICLALVFCIFPWPGSRECIPQEPGRIEYYN